MNFDKIWTLNDMWNTDWYVSVVIFYFKDVLVTNSSTEKATLYFRKLDSNDIG